MYVSSALYTTPLPLSFLEHRPSLGDSVLPIFCRKPSQRIPAHSVTQSSSVAGTRQFALCVCGMDNNNNNSPLLSSSFIVFWGVLPHHFHKHTCVNKFQFLHVVRGGKGSKWQLGPPMDDKNKCFFSFPRPRACALSRSIVIKHEQKRAELGKKKTRQTMINNSMDVRLEWTIYGQKR